MDRLYLALTAFFGGILIDLAGWAGSHEPFDWRKFLASGIKLLVAAAGWAGFYPIPGTLTAQLFFTAFLIGTGFDNLVTQVAGTQGWSSFPIPAKK